MRALFVYVLTRALTPDSGASGLSRRRSFENSTPMRGGGDCLGPCASRLEPPGGRRGPVQDCANVRHCLAVTRLQGDASAWSADPTIRECLGGNPFRFLTLEDMWGVVLRTVTTTSAASEMGRLAQLLKAAGLTAPTPISQPSGPQHETAAAEVEELASLD
jgi:hypothetical protein